MDRLVSFGADANGPAGMLRIYGSGGWRFYEGTSTFISPLGDNGTLSLSGGTYTYSTPDGQSWTFNSSGYMTQWTSADGQESLQYRYTSGNLTGLTAIDGTLSTLTYTGSSSVGILTSNSRRTTLTLASGDLDSITNPDTGVRDFSYASGHLLTGEEFGLIENHWEYTTHNTVGTITWGDETSPSDTVLVPDAILGLGSLVAAPAWAKVTDANDDTTYWQLDDKGRPLARQNPDGGLYSWTRDSNGWVSTQTDEVGRTTAFARDGVGYVTDETLPGGATRQYEYQDAFHALTTFTNERGYLTTYGYDASGHLIRTRDALGGETTYGWTAGGLLEQVSDARGNISTTVYDGLRRPYVSVNALTERTTLTFDNNGNARTVKDAELRVTTLTHDVMGRQIGGVNAKGALSTAVYDPSGLLKTSSDTRGALTSVAFDPYKRGLVDKAYEAVGTGVARSFLTSYDDEGQVSGERDALGSWDNYAYDSEGQEIGATDALGFSALKVHDAAGQLTAARDAQGRWTTYTYHPRGWVETVQHLKGTISYDHDARGNVTTITDERGETNVYTFDALDRPTLHDDALGKRTTTTFDAVGNATLITQPLGEVTSLTYDKLNRETARTTAYGDDDAATTSRTFDKAGNVKTTTDGLGKVTNITVDALDGVTEVMDPLGHSTLWYRDASGLVTMTEDDLGKQVKYDLDVLGRVTGWEDETGEETHLLLDAEDNVVLVDDAEPGQDVTIYDALQRPVGQVEGTGALTQWGLDGVGNVEWVMDAAGNFTFFAYDSDDQEVWRQDPTGATSTMAYDAAARLTGRTDRNGLRTEYLYDDEDRLIGETWKTSGGVTVNVVTYTRDDLGRVTSAADGTGTLVYDYDEQDRLEAYTNVWGLLLTYTYNDNHDVVRVDDWAGGVTTGVYDDARRLTSRQFGGRGQTPVRIDFGYNDRDDLTGIRRYSDLAATTLVGRTSLTYDDERRLTNLTNRNSGGTTLSSYSYAYDDSDRLTDEDWQTTTTTGTLSGARDYDYDAADQLTADGTGTYTYDLAGNRTMSGYQTGTANRLTTDGLWTYTYDSEGSLTQKSKGASLETWYFAFDHRKRMTSARQTSNGSTNVLLLTYTYDVADNRVQEQRWTSATGTVTTRFAFDRGHVMADLNGSNVIQVRRLYGDGVDQVLARITGGAVVAYLTDRLGSVRDLMDSSGQIQAHIEYDGYGIRTDTNASFADRYGFTGREWQFDVGLQYSRARWYDPRIGRWVSEDPIDFAAGDGNLYRYVGNGATNGIDPDGLEQKGWFRRGLEAVGAGLDKVNIFGALWDWGTAPDSAEMRKPIPREFNDGNQSVPGLRWGDSIPRENKLWYNNARSAFPWVVSGTMVLLGTMVVPGPEDLFIAWAARQGLKVVKDGSKLVLQRGRTKLGESQTRAAIAQYQTATGVARWTPPKGWNGPGPEKGRWLGDRGNSGWMDKRPEVQRIVKGEPIPFVEGRVVFDKWVTVEFKVPGVKGGRANRNADTKLIYKAVFEREGLGGPGVAYSQKKHEKLVTGWLNQQPDGFGGTGLSPHHAGGEMIQYVPKQLHRVQHTEVEAFIPRR